MTIYQERWTLNWAGDRVAHKDAGSFAGKTGMFAHWLATAWRSLVANPLFSIITIISLSIGCCGALLVGANIRQHLSFERWIPAADHIFILTRDMDEGSMSGAPPNIRVPENTVPAPMRDVVAGNAGR